MSSLSGRVEALLARTVTSIAAGAALLLAVALPAAYFASERASMEAAMRMEAKLGAISVSDLAMRNPELWSFENARMRGLLALLSTSSEPEWRQVTSITGEVVAEQGVMPQAPVLSVAEPIYDSGVGIGSVEVARSLRPLSITTAWVALFATVLGAVVFIALKVLPLRLLSRALAGAAHTATHDALTGLPNRVLFRDRLEQALARTRRDGGGVAVLYLDLDRFKEVNDTLGHAVGDRLLKEVSRRFGACLRETDTLARLGGDEFAVVQVSAQQPGDAEALARRLVLQLAEPFELGGHLVTIGTSVGVALRHGVAPAPADGGADAAGALLQEADVALYRAKGDGRGMHRFFEMEMNQRLLERRSLETDLREAVTEGQFRLHYQPQVDLTDRRIIGAEALIRWRHPTRGDVRPDQFIPLAEETGLIVTIGAWALREACQQATTWPPQLRVAVNVSPVQFRRPGFVACVDRTLREAGLEPARLELEVTEGVLLSDTEETLATLHELRALGVTIAMDDFGTGYSSLGYLRKFPFDKIKIDRSFICGLGQDPNAAEIVRAVLGISRALGIRANAEGVEEECQADMLRAEGCEEVQGFLFSRAVAPDEFAALLSAIGMLPVPTRREAAPLLRSVG